MLDKNIILDVGITNATKKDILEYIFTSIEKKTKPYFVVTPNPEILVFARKHESFQAILNKASLALPDGIGITIAGKILGKPFKERLTGTDFVDALCGEIVRLGERHVKKPITIGFLGGRQNIAEKTADCLARKYPGLKVVFAAPEWPASTLKNPSSTFYHLPSSLDILFVAFGFPKQEEWMAENIGKIPVRAVIGVGGAFDYISGRVGRAPLFLRRLGLEWLYRLIRQPWRLKRQLALLEFVILIFRELMTEHRRR